MGVFNVGLFSKPRYSAFPWNHNNKFSTKTGVIKPVATEFLDTGEVFDLNDISAICRQAPMLAPTLDTHYMDIHAFALRLRSLGNASRDPWVYEDFFNLNKNTDGSRRLPSFPLGCMFAANGFKTGTLYESLGFPIFTDFRKKYLDYIRAKASWVFDPVTSVGVIESDTTADYTIQVEDDLDLLFSVVPSSLTSQFTMGVSHTGTVDSQQVTKDYDIYNMNPFVVSGDYSGFRFGNSDYYAKDYESSVLLEGLADNFIHAFGHSSTLIGYIVRSYPDAFPELFQYVNTFPAEDLVYSPFGVCFAADWSDVFPLNADKFSAQINKDLGGINLLERVYERYHIDSVTILREFEEYLLEGALSLSQASAYSEEYASVYYRLESNGNRTGYYLDSIFEVLRQKLVNGFPLSLQTNFFTYRDPDTRPFVVYEIMIPSYFIEGYWKVLSDWYINTAIQNPDTFITDHIINREALESESGLDDCVMQFNNVNSLYSRFWKNDYFTSAFPSPQAGQAVGIPVNGTIVDLRNANAMQKLRERLLYAGQRFRDVLYAITGKKTSSAILEMSEVIGSWSLTINVDSVLQNSQSNENNPLASYGGTGLGYRSSGRGCKYVAEEPTIIIFLCSIRPQASYFQGLSRKFTRFNIYDYDIPQLANVGEQEVRLNELYVGADSPSTPTADNIRFGYQRRNGDFMWTPNEVHGEFQTSLDFWHNARQFDSKPSLGINFLQVNPVEDNLNRIFAVPSDAVDRWYCRIDFEGQVIRHLPKHVHYDL